MNLNVEHLDSNGNTINLNYNITKTAFLKHVGMAGLGYRPTVRSIRKSIGFLLSHKDFLKRKAFVQSKFSKPAPPFYDPDDIKHFSKQAGRAFSDFLARRISNAINTQTYEAALKLKGYKLNTGRPDLYCFNHKSQFAIESKGLSDSTVSKKDMKGHKTQSQRGPLSVHFSVASVSYNLYDKVQNKYHDPVSPEAEFNESLNRDLSRAYYRGFSQLLEVANDFPQIEIENLGSTFYIIPILPLDEIEIYDFPRRYNRNVNLLVDRRIRKYIEEGNLESNTGYIQDDRIYIDNDGIGLLID